MRILVYTRPTADQDRGGDWLQLQATLEPLRALGVQAKVSTDETADLDEYDLCLIWNSIAPVPALRYYFNARRHQKPVALVPFYWALERCWNAQAQWGEDASTPIARQLEDLRRAIHMLRQELVISGADAVLPLSRAEAQLLANSFDVKPERMQLIHAGVHSSFAQGDAARFFDRYRDRFDCQDFILCVGFIAPRKNQLKLIHALRDDPRPLVLLGDVETPDYAAACHRAADTRTRAPVLFLPRQDQTVVADALAAARVHVLVSLYDIGPLVTLEAAQAGCPQVVTTECGMREYLREDVTYADPEDLEEIRRAIDVAWEQAHASALATRIAREFTWERAAQEIYQALEWTLAHRRTPPDLSQDLARLSDLLESQVNLAWQLLQEQAAELQASTRSSKSAARENDVYTWTYERETALKAMEAWAHELEAANRAQHRTLERIYRFFPVRIAMSLQNFLARR